MKLLISAFWHRLSVAREGYGKGVGDPAGYLQMQFLWMLVKVLDNDLDQLAGSRVVWLAKVRLIKIGPAYKRPLVVIYCHYVAGA